MGRVQDKVALITGGASGIGRASALALAREGAKVAISDLQDEAGEATLAELEAIGADALYLHHDVTAEADWERVISVVVDRFGQLDILFNNAGVGGDGRAYPEAAVRRVGMTRRGARKRFEPFYQCRIGIPWKLRHLLLKFLQDHL